MATSSGEPRNWLLDIYIAGFFFDQVLGLSLAVVATTTPEILFFLTPLRLLSLGIAGLALLLTLQVLLAGLDKKLLVLPIYHLGGLAVMEVIGSASGPVSGEITAVQNSALGSSAVLWASILHSAIGLVGGFIWLHLTRQVGKVALAPPRTGKVALAPQRTGSLPARPAVAPSNAAVKPAAAGSPRPAATGPAIMKPGSISGAVEANAGGALILAQACLVLALLILGLNWKYFYNLARGPQMLTGAVLKAPGATRAVKSEAPALLAIEETTSSSVRLGRRRGLRRLLAVPLPDSKTYFYVATIDHTWVLVKTSENKPILLGFSGELAKAPDDVVAELTKSGDWDRIEWMVDTGSSYRTPGFWSGVGLLLLLSAGFMTASLTGRVRDGFSESPELAHLRSLGPLPAVLSRIEREINGFGATARVGAWWVTPQWIVSLDPRILVIPAATLVAAAPIAEVDSKTRKLTRAGIGLWTTADRARVSMWMEASAVLPVAQAIVERLPWAWLKEAAPFEDRWKSDRQGCLREADERRSGTGGAT